MILLFANDEYTRRICGGLEFMYIYFLVEKMFVEQKKIPHR